MLSAVPSPTPPPAGLLATDVQIWAASATTGAACIALAVAVISLLQRRGDREREAGRERSRARAQARLVTLASNLDLKKRQAPATSVLRFLAVNNYGDRAIVEVVGEAWAGDADIAAAPTFSEGPQVLPAGGDQLFILYLADRQEPVPGLAAWRLRWMDADGQRWCLDQQPQDTPVEYTGQPPRPYRSPRG